MKAYVYWIGKTFALNIYRERGDRCAIPNAPYAFNIKDGFINFIALGD